MRRSISGMGGCLALFAALSTCALVPARAQVSAAAPASPPADSVAAAAQPSPCQRLALEPAAPGDSASDSASNTASNTASDSASDSASNTASNTASGAAIKPARDVAIDSPGALPSPPPAKPPLRLVIPYWPGSGADQVARVLARVWSEVRHEPVLVCNMPEHRGRTAIRWMAAAPADGHWLLLTSSPLIPADVRIGELGDIDARPSPLMGDSRDRRPVLLPLARVGTLGLVTPIPEGFLPGRLSLPGPIDGEMIQAAVRAWRGTESSALPIASPPQDLPTPPPWPGRSDPRQRTTSWNVMLAPPGTPATLMSSLRDQLIQVLGDDRVRLTLVSAGTELWPEDTEQRPRLATITTPLPPR